MGLLHWNQVIQFSSTSHLKFEKVVRPALYIVSIISLLTKCTIVYLKWNI